MKGIRNKIEMEQLRGVKLFHMGLVHSEMDLSLSLRIFFTTFVPMYRTITNEMCKNLTV